MTAVLFLVAAVVLDGCDGADGVEDSGSGSLAGPVEPVRRDSAGVSILEFAADARERVAQFMVDTAAPLAVIGAREDGSDDMTMVRDIELLPDGSVVLWDNRSSLVHFGADGRLLRRVGRLGQGPGDFGTVSGMTLSDDTLFISDPANSRVAIYSRSLEHIGSSPIPDECRSLHLKGRIPGRGAVGFSGDGIPWDLPVTDTIQRALVPVLLVDSVGCDTVAALPGPQVRTVELTQRGRVRPQSVPVHFGLRSVVAAWDSVLVAGTGDDYILDVLDRDGHKLRSLRLDWSRVPTPAGLRDSIVARQLALMSGAGSERMIDAEASRRNAREHTYVSDSLPPYREFIVSTDGLLWVVEGYAPGMPEHSAIAFDRAGNLVKRLQMPGWYQIVEFGADRVLTRTEDAETGLVTLQVLRVHR